jgi:CubicO group peptidase (beta-lactamase class C family)
VLTTPLQLGPGEAFRYSDIGFILLGALIEKVTGEPEDVYVQHNVFAPLGVQDTRYLPPAKVWSAQDQRSCDCVGSERARASRVSGGDMERRCVVAHRTDSTG